MPRFSANLGFLWKELSLPDAIRAAKMASFDAVECHWPYSEDIADVKAALAETSIPMIGLNTAPGDLGKSEFGVTAISGREQESKEYIDQAIEYAVAVDCLNIHVMAGITDGSSQAEMTFCANLTYATAEAAKFGKIILIEPINQRDVPRYHLSTLDAAIRTLQTVNASNLKIMFDCYHMQITHGDVSRLLKKNLNHIGHIQIASVPDRTEPDHGEVNFPQVLQEIDAMDWNGFVGAEYRPRATVEGGLGWMNDNL